MTSTLAHLRRDRRGAALMEFGLVAPVLILALLGAFDIGHSLYLRSALQGQLQKAARDSALESGVTNAAALDRFVEDQVRNLASNAEIDFNRRYYRTFSKARDATAEKFTDTNKDGMCNFGEPFTDTNNNKTRDRDGGNSTGGAKDIMVYTVDVKYPRMFPMAKFIGVSPDVEVQAKAVIGNQPYGDQGSDGAATVRNCS